MIAIISNHNDVWLSFVKVTVFTDLIEISVHVECDV